MVDASQMCRVFVNIMKNAFDAMPNGGTLTITNTPKNDTIEIAFSDTGVGMSEETLNRIWTLLYTTKAKGMGFGLPICKRIVEAHGGKIHATSKQNKGTTMTLTLPTNHHNNSNPATNYNP
jgi:signal transduction histidine kinase